MSNRPRTDSLTGLLNRRALELVATQYAAHERASLVLIDVDRFKQINDRRGHAAGDQVLRDMAALIRALVPPESVLARFGGEEFAQLRARGQSLEGAPAA